MIIHLIARRRRISERARELRVQFRSAPRRVDGSTFLLRSFFFFFFAHRLVVLLENALRRGIKGGDREGGVLDRSGDYNIYLFLAVSFVHV